MDNTILHQKQSSNFTFVFKKKTRARTMNLDKYFLKCYSLKAKSQRKQKRLMIDLMNKNKRSLIIPNVKTIIFPLIAADKGHLQHAQLQEQNSRLFPFLIISSHGCRIFMAEWCCRGWGDPKSGFGFCFARSWRGDGVLQMGEHEPRMTIWWRKIIVRLRLVRAIGVREW